MSRPKKQLAGTIEAVGFPDTKPGQRERIGKLNLGGLAGALL
jgi:hypothetical protein